MKKGKGLLNTASLKTMYKVFGLPAKQVAGGRTTLENIRKAAEQQA